SALGRGLLAGRVVSGGGLAGFQRLPLLLRGVLVLLVLPGERALELTDPSSHRLAELRKALRPEADQDDYEDYRSLKWSNVGHRPDLSGTRGRAGGFTYRFRSRRFSPAAAPLPSRSPKFR